METETAPLLRARPTSRRRSWLVGSIALSSSLLFLRGMRGEQTRARGATVGSALAASGQASMDDDGKAQTWEIYKHATPVMNGQGRGIFDFVTQYLCPSMGPPTNLGCGGLKVGCTVKCASCTTGSAQLHWVDSKGLDFHSGSMKVEGWESYFKHLNANMTFFNAFMHNKNQLYVLRIGAIQAALDNASVPYYRRVSKYPHLGNYEIAHIGVDVAGRVVEIVGPYENLHDNTDFNVWADIECPAAHALSYTEDEYNNWAMSFFIGDDEVDGWEDRMEVSTPLFVGTSASSHDPQLHGEMMTEMYNYTGAKATLIEESDYCTVMTLTWPDFEGWEFRYVHNKQAPIGSLSLEDYDTYIEDVHMQYIAQASSDGGSWFNWDHWLDQHVGLKYQETGDTCVTMDRAVRKTIFEHQIPVGERRSADGAGNETTHYYTGFKGSVAWEMNVLCSTDDGAPDVCACIGANNDELFHAKEGYSCSSTEALEGDPIFDDDMADDDRASDTAGPDPPGPAVSNGTNQVDVPDADDRMSAP